MRTLVVHIGGIGDMLLAAPAIEWLARQGPVELLGRPERAKLLVAGGIAQAAHDVDSTLYQSLFAGEPAPELRRFLAGFDRAVIWMRDANDIKARLVSCGIGEVQAFPGLPPDSWRRHASEYYLDCVGTPASSPFRLDIAPSETAHDIIIHPGSGGTRKNWPMENFVAVAERLRARRRRVIWIAGPAEESLAFPVEPIRIDGLVELARILRASNLYIGNDSGISHLAAAAGCPSVAIFGPTDPRVWAPRGMHTQIVSADAWPAVEAVLKAVEGGLGG